MSIVWRSRKHLAAIGVMIGVSLTLGLAPRCRANGYRVLCVKSAKATAMGEAFRAQADDPTALTFNPAGLAQLDGMRLSLQGTYANAYTEREAPGGGPTTDIEDIWQLVPAAFASSNFGLENVTFGLGISVPNGLSSEWAEDSFARYSATYSDLFVADIAAGVGIRVSDELMAGASLNYYYSELDFERMVYAPYLGFPPGTPDVKNDIEGDGDGWGFTLGLLWTPADRHTFALFYRHAFQVDYSGDNTLEGIGTSPMRTSIDFPAVLGAGYAFRPNDRWVIEFDVDWTNWEKVDKITVASPGMREVVPYNYKNTFSYKLGAQYQWSECLALRGGYIYNENATPESTWAPSLPDTESHFFTGGFGYTIGPVTIDAALQLVLYETRTIDRSPDMLGVNGTYRNWAPCASLGMTYTF